MNAEPAGFRELLDLLGIGGQERVSLCHEPPGESFRVADIFPASQAPQEAAKLAGSVWYGINPTGAQRGRGKAEAVSRVVAAYLDLDYKGGGLGSEENARTLIDNLSAVGMPSVIVSTGGGLQPYYLLKGGEDVAAAGRVLRRFERFARTVAESMGLGTIDAVADVARVFRVPGTLNHKYNPPRPVGIEVCEDGDVLLLDELATVLDELGVPDEGEQGHEVVLAAGDWEYRAEGACPYAVAMVNGWRRDVPEHGRHPWLVSQAVRLAALHRHGCVSREKHAQATEILARRFGQVCRQGIGGSVRKVPKYEVASALVYGVQRVECKSDQEVADELGGHEHPPPFDAGAFWASRPSLTHVHDFARARRAGPFGVLGVVLARLIAAVPPFVVLPPMVGGEASLNAFVALVGESGTGKGACEAAGRDALVITSLREAEVMSPGSGEGLAHIYARRVRGGGIERLRESVVLSVAEVDTLTALNSRQGATLDAELRKAWVGERLGFAFVDESKRVPIEPHSYRLAMLVGVQPSRAGALLATAEGGTPQRFVWLPMGDPEAPDEVAEEPAPMEWGPPTWPYADYITGRVQLPVCEEARAEIDEQRLATLRGEPLGDPLDGHLMLVRLKLAAALALLDEHAGVRAEDWALAGDLMSKSAQVRDGVRVALARDWSKRNRAQGHAEAERVEIVEERRGKRLTDQAVTALLRVTAKHAADGRHAGGGCRRRCLRDACGRQYRDALDAAVAKAVADGLLVEVPAKQGGTNYRPGKQR